MPRLDNEESRRLFGGGERRKSSPSVRVSGREEGQQNQQMACYFACAGGLASVKHRVSGAPGQMVGPNIWLRDYRGSEESGKCVGRH